MNILIGLAVLQGTSIAWNMPLEFISVILLPIVGNAAEHASAIMFDMKDKLDISLGVAIGSSTQISMFGISFSVVVGWMMGLRMDLDYFQLFETATLFITVLVVAFMLQEGTSNYFKGLMLILCYLIFAASFFVHEDSSQGDDNQPKTYSKELLIQEIDHQKLWFILMYIFQIFNRYIFPTSCLCLSVNDLTGLLYIISKLTPSCDQSAFYDSDDEHFSRNALHSLLPSIWTCLGLEMK
nr:vacuolar cation/proton exchanger 5 [Quercus suber]